MFFAERINSISNKDLVLEIGPGANPHPRSNVFLELQYNSKEEEQSQFGYTGRLVSEKPIVYYDGNNFPFKDKEFDYVICSHVLEHVPDVEFFLSELQRISYKGYLEFPTIYYDYLFNFDVHQNFLLWDGTQILWRKKKDFPLEEFQPVQSLFREALEKQATSVVAELRDFIIQGFEWSEEIKFVRAENLDLLCFENSLIEDKRYKEDTLRTKANFRQKLKIKLKFIIDTYL